MEAIARMNYIHSVHQKNGRISNDDMLYTLSLFAREPVRWVKEYEWRNLSDMEVCAIGTFWKAIGDAMNIDMSPLPGGKKGWKHGLQWHEEIDAWSEQYEKDKMVPDPNNRKTADQTIELLIWAMPAFLKPIGRSSEPCNYMLNMLSLPNRICATNVVLRPSGPLLATPIPHDNHCLRPL